MPNYKEYMPPRDLLRFKTVGQRIVDAIRAVRGRVYTSQASIALYPTTGTAGDYAYSRHIASPRLRKTYGYTFETGPFTGDAAQSFHPADPTLIKRDAKAGMLTLAHQCICAIELIGWTLLGRAREITILRAVRDDLLATTVPGRDWIGLFERVQHNLLAVILADKRMTKEAGELLKRAGQLLDKETAKPSDEDVGRAETFLRELADRTDDRAIKSDLKKVSGAISRVRGRSTREAIEMLMGVKPAA